VHYVLHLFRGFLRAKFFVDTQSDRFLSIARPAKMCDRGYYFAVETLVSTFGAGGTAS